MPDIEFAVKEPNIGFDACAAPADSVVERLLSPVVIVRVARQRHCTSLDIRCVRRCTGSYKSAVMLP